MKLTKPSISELHRLSPVLGGLSRARGAPGRSMSELDELRTSLETRTNEELVSILRNWNEDEWRPEVFDLVASILSTRGIPPAMVLAMGPEGEDVIEDRPLATVARYFSPAEAHAGRRETQAKRRSRSKNLRRHALVPVDGGDSGTTIAEHAVIAGATMTSSETSRRRRRRG
jgi:hypothetical protein